MVTLMVELFFKIKCYFTWVDIDISTLPQLTAFIKILQGL